MADFAAPPQPIKVKRDGPRGWHWIAAENFDPARHELFEEAEQEVPPAAAAPTPDKPRRGRPPKHQPTEAINGDR